MNKLIWLATIAALGCGGGVLKVTPRDSGRGGDGGGAVDGGGETSATDGNAKCDDPSDPDATCSIGACAGVCNGVVPGVCQLEPGCVP